MDPATIAALCVGVASFVSIIAAGIVACCRKQSNAANDNDQTNSRDYFIMTITESQEVTVTKKNGDTKVTKTSPAIKVEINLTDSRGNNIAASNIQNGFDNNTVPVVPANGSIATAAAAVTESSGTPAASSSNTVAVATTETTSHPAPIDPRIFSQDRPQAVSKINIRPITISAKDLRFEFGGLDSSDFTGAQTSSTQTIALEQHINEDDRVPLLTTTMMGDTTSSH